MKRENLDRQHVMATVLGIIIIIIGICFCVKADLGTDPFTTFNKGLSKKIGVSFGVCQITFNILIIGVVYFIDKTRLYLGTILNMFMIGPLVDLFSVGINAIIPDFTNIGIRCIVMALGCIIIAIGVGLYMGAEMGIGPYDLVSLLLAEKNHWDYKWIRASIDVLVVGIGWILGATVGIGTILLAVCLGPLINYFRVLTIQYLNVSKCATK